MKLRPQPARALPRDARRAPQQRRRRGIHLAGRSSGRGASRPQIPLRRRLARHLPSLRRAAALVGTAATVGALVWLLEGPWLRVGDVAWAGARHTEAADLERALADQRGRSALAINTSLLRDRLERLPAVASASVSVTLPGAVRATVAEHDAAFVWHTPTATFLGSADGTVFAAVAADQPLSAELAALPQIHDERFAARRVGVGDVIAHGVVHTALRLAAVDPAALGSTASQLAVRLDDEYGFRLASASPQWEVAFGNYGVDPAETAGEADARLERQIAAVRTLFASRGEAEIGWVDVRNPGKVYFRAKG